MIIGFFSYLFNCHTQTPCKIGISSSGWLLITFPSGGIQSVNIWSSVQPTIHCKNLPNILVNLFEVLFFHSVLLATFLKVGTTYMLMVLNTFFVSTVNFKIALTSESWNLTIQKNLRYFLHWKPFKKAKKTFHFIFKALSILKVFKFLPWLFGHVEKIAWLERQIWFWIHDVTTWLMNNCNIHIPQYLMK